MKKFLLFIFIIWSGAALAQKTTGANYTYIAQRYEWTAGVFKGLGLPAGSGPAAFQSGQEPRAGAVYYDSLGADAGFYVYTGTAWVLQGSPAAVELPDELIQPGYVTYSGTGFKFYISPSIIRVAGVIYGTDYDSVTLSASDPDDPRKDVIYVATTGIEVAEGIPAGPAAEPQLDAGQFKLTVIDIPEGATVPGISQYIIWDENTESVVTNSGTTTDPDDVSNPYHLTKDINITNFGNSDQVVITLPSTVNANNYNGISLFLKNKVAIPAGTTIRIIFYNRSTKVSSEVIMGITPGQLTYQGISLPMTKFSFSNSFFDVIKIRYVGNTVWAGAYLDYIYMQSGLVQGGGNGTPLTIGPIDGKTSVPNGAVIENNILYNQSASQTNPGLMSPTDKTKLDSLHSDYFIENLGDGEPLALQINDSTIGIKSIGAGTNITFTVTGTKITINSSGASVPTLQAVTDAGNTTTTDINSSAVIRANDFQVKPAYTSNWVALGSYTGNGTSAYGNITLREFSTGAGNTVTLSPLDMTADIELFLPEASNGDTIATKKWARDNISGGGGGLFSPDQTSTGNANHDGGGFQFNMSNIDLVLTSMNGNQIALQDGSGNLLITTNNTAYIEGVAGISLNGTTGVSGTLNAANLIVDANGKLTLGSSSSESGSGNGNMYYNSTTNKFRAYENGAWVDMIGETNLIVQSLPSSLTPSVAIIVPRNDSLLHRLINSGINYILVDTLSDGSVRIRLDTASSTLKAYIAANSGGMTNPMTTSQDIIVGGASGTPTRLGVGTNGQRLGVSAGNVTWVDNDATWNGLFLQTLQTSSTSVTLSTHGLYTYVGTADATFTLPALSSNLNRMYMIKNSSSFNVTVQRAGSDNLFTTSSVTSITIPAGSSRIIGGTTASGTSYWHVMDLSEGGGGMTNPMTTTGDIIYSSDNSGTPARLAAGTSGYALISNGAGTAPSWQAVSGSGTVNSGTQYRIGYYATTGTAISEAAAITASRALVSDANGVPTHATATTAEVNRLVGVTSDIQTQIDGKQPKEIGVIQAADYTLTSTTSTQKLFDAVTNGAITVSANTTYLFEMYVNLSSMSVTSGNGGFDIVGAGTATTTSIDWTGSFRDGAFDAGAGPALYHSTVSASTGNITTASTSTLMYGTLTGVIRVNAGGTIIPSVYLTTAAAAVVETNSYFKLTPIGSGSVTSW